MLFHIFGNNLPEFNCKLKDDLASDPKDYNKTLEEYSELISNGKYTDLYFIVDFCSYKTKLLEKFNYISIMDGKGNKLPFIILSEYHLDDNNGKSAIFRNDPICIITKGFVHKFQDNKAALERFLYCINNRIPCNIQLRANENDEFYVQICDTRSAMLAKHRISKFSMIRV